MRTTSIAGSPHRSARRAAVRFRRRVISGAVAVGAASVAVPLYISELAPPESRDALVFAQPAERLGRARVIRLDAETGSLVSMPSAWIPRLAALRHLGLCGLVPATGRVDDLAAATQLQYLHFQPDWPDDLSRVAAALPDAHVCDAFPVNRVPEITRERTRSHVARVAASPGNARPEAALHRR